MFVVRALGRLFGVCQDFSLVKYDQKGTKRCRSEKIRYEEVCDEPMMDTSALDTEDSVVAISQSSVVRKKWAVHISCFKSLNLNYFKLTLHY